MLHDSNMACCFFSLPLMTCAALIFTLQPMMAHGLPLSLRFLINRLIGEWDLKHTAIYPRTFIFNDMTTAITAQWHLEVWTHGCRKVSCRRNLLTNQLKKGTHLDVRRKSGDFDHTLNFVRMDEIHADILGYTSCAPTIRQRRIK